MPSKPSLFPVAGMLLLAASLSLTAADWNRFRGPNGSGNAEAGKLPVTLDAGSTLWKIPVGKGWSSPVLWKDMIVLTAETGPNKRAVFAFSAADGKQLWKFEEEFSPYHIHNLNNLASSTPFVDDKRIYINWSSGTAIQAMALDHKGKPVWRNDHVADYIHEHGTGASAFVEDGVMVVRSEFSYKTEQPKPGDPAANWKPCIVGLDASSGKQVWKLEIPLCLNTYSTPVTRNLPGGKKEIICADTAMGVMGIDVKSGKINWQHNPGYKQRSLGSGVLSDDFYFCTFGTGGGVNEVAALDLKGGKPQSVNYSIPKGLPYVPSPLVIGQHMYLLGDGGILRCVEFKTGKVLYEERVEGVGGSARFFSSPVAGDGKIYCSNQQGDVVVVKVGTTYEKLSATKLDSPINATPAIADGRIFIRTANSLYCMGSKPKAAPIP